MAMANVISKSMVAKYLAELTKDERNIEEAAEAYEAAKGRLDVGLRRYVALRDFVTEQMGESPYMPHVDWPEDENTRYTDFGRTQQGGWHFSGMKVGDAVLQLFKEHHDANPDVWHGLDDIVSGLSDGGLGFPDPVQARAVNAALLRPPVGVVRGQYTKGSKAGQAAYKYDSAKAEEAEREEEEARSYVGHKGFADEEIDVDDLPFE